MSKEEFCSFCATYEVLPVATMDHGVLTFLPEEPCPRCGAPNLTSRGLKNAQDKVLSARALQAARFKAGIRDEEALGYEIARRTIQNNPDEILHRTRMVLEGHITEAEFWALVHEKGDYERKYLKGESS